MKKPIKFGARKRYEEGGEVEEGERAKEYVASKAETAPSTFREAFAQARKAGQERFTFNGKSYTTEMAGSKPAAPKPAASKPTAKTESASLEVRASRLPRSTDDDSSSVFAPRAKEAVEKVKERLTSGREFSSKPAESKTSRSEEDSSVFAPGARELMGRLKTRLTSGHEFGKKHGGKVHKYAKGGSVGSASKRADGIAMRGKTRGKMV
jgi:hypothetical protein